MIKERLQIQIQKKYLHFELKATGKEKEEINIKKYKEKEIVTERESSTLRKM